MRYKLEQLFTANSGAYLFYFLRVCTWMGVINFQHFGNIAAPWKYLCMGIFSDESCVTRSATDSFCIPSKGCLIVIAFCRQGRTIHQLYSSIMTSMINYSTNVCGFYQKIVTECPRLRTVFDYILLNIILKFYENGVGDVIQYYIEMSPTVSTIIVVLISDETFFSILIQLISSSY